MSRHIVYPLVAPLPFALALAVYHWNKLSLELFGWNLLNSYLLFLVPSLIAAAVDSMCLRRRVEARLAVCIATMLLVTVFPFVALIPGARLEGSFMVALGLGAIFSAALGYWVSNLARSTVDGSRES